MKNLTKLIFAMIAACGALSSTSSAHTVALGWDVQSNGDVDFWNLHWHGNVGSTQDTGLFIDGIEYKFQTIHNDINSISGLDGAIVNTSYASFVGDTITVNNYSNDWFKVTVSGLAAGAHTFGTTNVALTSWYIPVNGTNITSIDVVIPSVPTSAHTLSILGLSLLGCALAARRRK